MNYLDDYKSSYINLSTVSFLNCSFLFQQQPGSVASTYSTTNFYAYQHFVSSTTTISGGSVTLSCATNSVTNILPINIPLSTFRVSGGTFNLQNVTATNMLSKSNLLSLYNNAVVSLSNVSWTITGSTSSSFIEIRTPITSLSLNNITGSVPINGDGTIPNENYFMIFIGWDKMTAGNITMTNVASTLGYVLDATRISSATAYQSLYYADTVFPVLRYGITILTSVSSINFLNCDVGGFKFIQLTYSSSYYIQGCSTPQIRVKIRRSTFTGVPIQIDPSTNQYFLVSLSNCVGSGTDLLNANGNTIYSLDLTTVRNRGFTGVGTLLNQPWINANSILNDFNNGTAQYLSYDLSYETSTAARTGGAGYAIKIIKKIDDNLPVYYPNIGDDATWIYIPTAGNYLITAYLIYTCSSGTLASADLKLAIDVMGVYSTEYSNSSLSGDTSSWPSISGTAIKLTITITTIKEQYCPVRLIINKKLSGLIIYFDPKVVVTSA